MSSKNVGKNYTMSVIVYSNYKQFQITWVVIADVRPHQSVPW